MSQHVVFLQGMPCSFFRSIACELNAEGVSTSGISLCAGDRWFMPGPTRVHYRGRLAQWPEFIAQHFRETRASDLVLLGEQRQYHVQAIAVAQSLGMRVHVTDFGYLRPDWITFERDGMSGNSRLPRDAESIRAQAAGLTEIDTARRYHDSFLRMALGDLLVSFTTLLFFFVYPRYQRTEKRPHPLIYFPAMGLRLLTTSSRNRVAVQQFLAFRAKHTPYYLVPMQLEHDFQMQAYSPYTSGRAVITSILASFAQHAPPEAQLIFKCHPLDPGLRRWSRIIREEAHAHGVDSRVQYLDGGDLQQMIAGARGMVTVNSTAALNALTAHCPVIALGEAIYHIAGLTHQVGLDSFWQHPTPPDQTLMRDFMRLLVHRHQIRGVFFSNPGMQDAALRAATILQQQHATDTHT